MNNLCFQIQISIACWFILVLCQWKFHNEIFEMTVVVEEEGGELTMAS